VRIARASLFSESGSVQVQAEGPGLSRETACVREIAREGGDPGDARVSLVPLVSVLTPSFNQARWLDENLASVQAQTYPNIEHIVMDGGSTDGSVELLRSQAFANVRWWSEPDAGQSHALNKAFRASRGEIIGWINSDDAYFQPDAIADAVSFFSGHPNVDVVYGHAALVDSDGLCLQAMWTPPYSRRLLRCINYVIQPAAFVRRSAIGAYLADERYQYAMDRELWLRLAASHRFGRLDRILAIDRHHPARKSYLRPDLAREDGLRLSVEYGVSRSTAHKAVVKALKIAFRLLGVTLVSRMSQGQMLPAIRCDSRMTLALRQVLVPRARMLTQSRDDQT
jgi:glycosyltransferase involved in cell wall biosynthesis